jgi:hypothetical protein
LEFFAALPPCLVGIEACPTAHYWSRRLQALGHNVRHLGLELGLDGGERERVLHIVVVKIAFAGRNLVALAVLPVGALGRSLERSRRGGRRGTFGAGDYRAGWYLRDDDAIELDDPMGWEPLSQ